MSRPLIRLIDAQTNEVIDREMNDQEFEVYEAKLAAKAEAQRQKDEQAAAKAALLEKLGITEDEAKLLLS
jgi:hypothetical protein